MNKPIRLSLVTAIAIAQIGTFGGCIDLNINMHQSNRQANPDVNEGTVENSFSRENDISEDVDSTKIKASLR